MTAIACAQRIRVRGVVQGVGFRPCVFRLARTHHLGGWVSNGGDGVEIHVEGTSASLDAFVRDLGVHAPPAAVISSMEIAAAPFEGCQDFEIRGSRASDRPTTRISADLPMCAACERELFDATGRRARYPYINCTDCGPRFSIVESLPYDRAATTMAPWAMCAACAGEYGDPGDRRFHAQPVACPECGPHYYMRLSDSADRGLLDEPAIRDAARRLADGAIVAIKGVGGYHLACDAENASAVSALRERKFRKDKPFAVMARDLDVARRLVVLSAASEALLASPARPIVLAPKRVELAGVAPNNSDLGVILPYAPVHALLFAAGAPEGLVMTSGNRSSEPIAYEDEDALVRLDGLADAWLVGERPIARRLDDSVARIGPLGPTTLRRSRGYAPGAVARLPGRRPILALGGDLKNTVTLVVDGQAYVAQHVGDLEHHAALTAFDHTVQDLLTMWDVSVDDLLVVHDQHPQYASTRYAESLPAARLAVQHHRAHIASVLAEHGELDRGVIGVALDGTGYGDDGSIWGGELFAGSVSAGFERVGGLRSALLAGGDAAARHPAQAAAGFLAQLPEVADLTAPPFGLPARYTQARALVDAGVRVFRTSSTGRLFDAVAALLGFTSPITFEGQAAMWLEHLAEGDVGERAYTMPFEEGEIDWRPAIAAIVHARLSGEPPPAIARAFHRGLAQAVARAVGELCHQRGFDTAVASGGVFQNNLLMGDLAHELDAKNVRVWINHAVPTNDGGISLGQAAIAACTARNLRPSL